MAAAELVDRVMGSELRIVAVDPPPGALAAAVEQLRALEARWSPFEPDTDLARLHRSAGTPVAVSPSTLVLVESMLAAWSSTGGAYDPTLLPVLVAHGGGWSRTAPHRLAVLPDGPVRWGAAAEIVVDRVSGTVRVPVGIALDASGIGKGLAADLAVAGLLAAGAAGALVSIGGDLACAGRAPDEAGWTVVVEQPDLPGAELTRWSVSAGGVATSSTRSHRWRVAGGERHPTVDPRTGAPASTDLAAVTVIATCGWMAEALATAALLATSSGVDALLAASGASGLWVDDVGGVHATADVAAASGLVTR